MQRFNKKLAKTVRGTNTGITKVKAVSRLSLAGRREMRRVAGIDDLLAQNINYVKPPANADPNVLRDIEWRKTEEELDLEEIQCQKFLGYWKGVYRLYGEKQITNLNNVDPETRYEIIKLIRSWPHFDDRTLKRVWDQNEERHQACLSAMAALTQNENEKERKTRNMTLIKNLKPFLVNPPVTVVCILPEEFPNHGEDELKDMLPRRTNAGGRLQRNVHEFLLTIAGNLTLESFLRALFKYQEDHSPFRQMRQPKFIQLLKGSDPANPLEIPHQPAAIPMTNNYEFHQVTSDFGPEILGAGTRNGLYLHVVMHRYVPDQDKVNNVLRNVPPHQPLERYANFDTYIDKTWPLPKRLKELDVKGWIECGNPDKVLTNGKLVTPLPSRQDQSEDDDSENEEQRMRYRNKKERRIQQQTALWKTHFLRPRARNTKTIEEYHRYLAEIDHPNVKDRDELERLGAIIDARNEVLAMDQRLGETLKPEMTFLEQRSFGARLVGWVRGLAHIDRNQPHAFYIDAARKLYQSAVRVQPVPEGLREVIRDLETMFREGGAELLPNGTDREKLNLGCRVYWWALDLPNLQPFRHSIWHLENGVRLIVGARAALPAGTMEQLMDAGRATWIQTHPAPTPAPA